VNRLRREATSPLARVGSLAVLGGALVAGHTGIAIGAGAAALLCWTIRPPGRSTRRR
jgi:hypothetical protein